MSNFKEQLHHVKAFVFDVDGVFSSSQLLLHPSGDMMRTMNIKDGYATHYLVRKGFPVAIISGGNSEAVRTRFERLGVKDIFMQSSDKMRDFLDFLQKYRLDPMNVLYMGDDLPDYPVMQMVGMPTCPADAVEEIKSVSRYISHRNGGDGCVRDVIEQVLRLKGIWLEAEAFSW